MAITVKTAKDTKEMTGRWSNHFTVLSYTPCVLSYALLNPLYIKKLDGLLFSKNNAQRAGVSVNELKPLNTVEAAIVNANCLYN